MRAKVFFLRLTDEQRAELNGGGWNGDIGRRYLAAKDGAVDANLDLFEHAATVDAHDAHDAESIWAELQNVFDNWAERRERHEPVTVVEVLTTFPRSMDVGDFVLWEDGRRERVADAGFEQLPEVAG